MALIKIWRASEYFLGIQRQEGSHKLTCLGVMEALRRGAEVVGPRAQGGGPAVGRGGKCWELQTVEGTGCWGPDRQDPADCQLLTSFIPSSMGSFGFWKRGWKDDGSLGGGPSLVCAWRAQHTGFDLGLLPPLPSSWWR